MRPRRPSGPAGEPTPTAGHTWLSARLRALLPWGAAVRVPAPAPSTQARLTGARGCPQLQTTASRSCVSSAPAGLSRDEDSGRLHGAKKGSFHEIFNLTENERPLAGGCAGSLWPAWPGVGGAPLFEFRPGTEGPSAAHGRRPAARPRQSPVELGPRVLSPGNPQPPGCQGTGLFRFSGP